VSKQAIDSQARKSGIRINKIIGVNFLDSLRAKRAIFACAAAGG
jgi:hypothetical protein